MSVIIGNICSLVNRLKQEALIQPACKLYIRRIRVAQLGAEMFRGHVTEFLCMVL